MLCHVRAACTFLLKHKKLTWRSTIGSLTTQGFDTPSEDVSNMVQLSKFHKKKDKHRRTVTYSCRQLSKQSSHIVCPSHSPVASGTSLFGEITLVFTHVFNGRCNKLLYVHWFDKYEVDSESKLIMINKNSLCATSDSNCSVVSPESLSRPFLHVYDCDKLWILNYNVSVSLS